jgi:hypothetical protein
VLSLSLATNERKGELWINKPNPLIIPAVSNDLSFVKTENKISKKKNKQNKTKQIK